MGEAHSLFDVELFGHTYGFSFSIVVQWVIILILAAVSIAATRKLERIPGKRQSAVELVVDSLGGFVKSTMGEEYGAFIPYIGTLIAYLFLMNLTGLVGIDPPTMDYGVALGMALITFLVIQVFAIKKLGLGHYFLGYAKPLALLLPMNLMERFLLPVSLSLRLFGNMTAAGAIMKIIYESLAGVSWFAQIGIPVPLHMYFDIFDGVVQMIVFTMLTMINIKIIVEH